MKPDALLLRTLLHAPAAAALSRTRNNAHHLAADDPAAERRIVVNGDAVAAVLDAPDPILDTRTLVCPNTLARGAALSLALMQREGWCCVRA